MLILLRIIGIWKGLLDMTGFEKLKKLTLVACDICLITLAYIATIYVRYDFQYAGIYVREFLEVAIILVIPYVVSFVVFKLYDSLWKYVSIEEMFLILSACIGGAIVSKLISIPMEFQMSISLTVIANILAFVFVSALRISFRVYRRLVYFLDSKFDKGNSKTVMIIGAGTTTDMLLKDIKVNKRNNYRVQALIDDDRNKVGKRIHGIKVCGTREDIERIARERGIDLILIAIPGLSGDNKANILEKCKQTKAKVQIIPDIFEVMDGRLTVNTVRDINIEDLLRREEVTLDMSGISHYIRGKVVTVTGGGGSIGSELCRQIATFNPKKLVIIDIYENNAYDLQNELIQKYPKLNMEVLIASVRDRKRLENIFEEHKPQVVFHAAAHKHVPLMERSPMEAIKNNVFGTLNVVETAHKFKIERFVMISTDKAVNPTNVMGATKRMCEMIVQAYDTISDTHYAAVRFGNVLGSNGSVIPLFLNQIKAGGPVTVTSEKITRFFMTIPEAAKLVLQAGAYANGGEIFVLDMGKPVKIYDLACDLIKLSGYEPNKDMKIEITGLRPGEKMYEELLMNEEGLGKTGHNKIFVGRPSAFSIVELKEKFKELERVIERNDEWELREKIGEIVPTYVNEYEMEGIVG